MKIINKELFEYLYNELGAIYDKNPSGVKSNLENDIEKNLAYLGTYFPRSYVESYKIYNNLFKNNDIYEKFNKKNIIRVLDIGSGIGGNLFGLLQVLMERFDEKVIDIVSIEGNRNAVDLQLQIFKDFKRFVNYNNTVKGSVNTIKFNDKSELELKLSKLGLDNTIDIMQSFKVVNEFYRRDYENNKGMYSHLLYLGNKWLKKSGILCIVDVTDKINGGEYASIIFNEEVKKNLCNKESDLVYVIPRCCAMNYRKCTKEKICFSRRTFDIHFNECTDKSKINYKVFIKRKLGDKVIEEISHNVCKWDDDIEYTCYCKDVEDNCNCTKKFIEPYLL